MFSRPSESGGAAGMVLAMHDRTEFSLCGEILRMKRPSIGARQGLGQGKGRLIVAVLTVNSKPFHCHYR